MNFPMCCSHVVKLHFQNCSTVKSRSSPSGKGLRINRRTLLRFWRAINRNTIRDGGSTALYAAYTVDTVYIVDMVYAFDMVYTVDMVDIAWNTMYNVHCN